MLDNGFFPVVKSGNQISGLTVSYVYKTNATINLSGSQTITYGSSNDIDPTKFTINLSNKKSYTLQNGDLKLVEDTVKNVGTYHVVLTDAGLDHIKALDSTNYEWIYDTNKNTTNLGTFIIDKAPATYTLSGTDSKTYDGKTTKIDDVLSSYSVTLSNGESYTLKAGDLQFNKDPKDKDKYVVSLTAAGIKNIQAVDSNYDFTAGDEVTGSYEIKAAGATYTLSGTDS
ncbi:MBG domain-containing protein, partial [Pediococcus argentinicus]|uniref:MBG domain-containing protein n=3 Tax=Pediococcus argentinicus TaxID=480391 RepID=UPI003CD0D73D